ncbi:MAG: winged helix-turn-helix domain-containing protein [Candidatus Diapherotrites archaeon]
MKKIEFVYREILFRVLEKKAESFTQKELSNELGLSLSMVNHALKPLKRMNAIKVNPRNFVVVNAKKILLYWSSVRNLEKDLIYKTRVDESVLQIEKRMPAGVIFTAYSGYKFKFNSVPADYSEVYIYTSDEELKEVKKRFPENKKTANLFVLSKDSVMGKDGKIATDANIFADLWNLPQWYAKDFLKEFEVRLNAVLE